MTLCLLFPAVAGLARGCILRRRRHCPGADAACATLSQVRDAIRSRCQPGGANVDGDSCYYVHDEAKTDANGINDGVDVVSYVSATSDNPDADNVAAFGLLLTLALIFQLCL